MKKMDVFPAIVYFAAPNSLQNYTDLGLTGERPQGTRKVDRARAAVINDLVLVYVDSPEGPKLVFRERISAYERDSDHKTHHILTESGKILAVGKDLNCGCGSRLRGIALLSRMSDSVEDPDA